MSEALVTPLDDPRTRTQMLTANQYVRHLAVARKISTSSNQDEPALTDCPYRMHYRAILFLIFQEANPRVPDLRHKVLVPLRNHTHRDHDVRRQRRRVSPDEAGEVVEEVADDALRHEGRVRSRVRRRLCDGRGQRGDLGHDLGQGLDREPEKGGDVRGRSVRCCVGEDSVCVRGLGGVGAAQAENGRGFLVGEPSVLVRRVVRVFVVEEMVLTCLIVGSPSLASRSVLLPRSHQGMVLSVRARQRRCDAYTTNRNHVPVPSRNTHTWLIDPAAGSSNIAWVSSICWRLVWRGRPATKHPNIFVVVG